MLPTGSSTPCFFRASCAASTSSWTRSMDLKYLTVFTWSSAVASSSTTMSAHGCSWSAESVQRWLTPSSIALESASALRCPVTTTITSRDSSTVATPTVSAMRGTAAMSLLKKRAFARIVSYASVLMRVRDARDEPMCAHARDENNRDEG